MYLLDTNIISELRKPRPHGGVVAWVQGVESHQLFIAAITLAEIQAGIEITRERDEEKAAQIEQWLNLVANAYNVIPMDGTIFRVWAKLMHRTSNTLYEDAMIAATAKVQNLIVVTRNLRDFHQFDVSLFNPFDGTTR